MSQEQSKGSETWAVQAGPECDYVWFTKTWSSTHRLNKTQTPSAVLQEKQKTRGADTNHMVTHKTPAHFNKASSIICHSRAVNVFLLFCWLYTTTAHRDDQNTSNLSCWSSCDGWCIHIPYSVFQGLNCLHFRGRSDWWELCCFMILLKWSFQL